MSVPNCIIALSLYDPLTTPRFSYHCNASSNGWHVQPDGSIHPPSRSRIVQIRASYPANANFTGFQLVSDPSNFPSKITDPWSVEANLGFSVIEPNPFPPQTGTSVPVLTLDFAGTGQLLYYQLAVNGHWDDPKIYLDPDQ